METIKATCLYCGMVGEMKVIDKYFIDGRPGRLFEVECPRCHRPFGHHVDEKEHDEKKTHDSKSNEDLCSAENVGVHSAAISDKNQE